MNAKVNQKPQGHTDRCWCWTHSSPAAAGQTAAPWRRTGGRRNGPGPHTGPPPPPAAGQAWGRQPPAGWRRAAPWGGCPESCRWCRGPSPSTVTGQRWRWCPRKMPGFKLNSVTLFSIYIYISHFFKGFCAFVDRMVMTGNRVVKEKEWHSTGPQAVIDGPTPPSLRSLQTLHWRWLLSPSSMNYNSTLHTIVF